MMAARTGADGGPPADAAPPPDAGEGMMCPPEYPYCGNP
jgi:hypothetical protein